MVRFRASEGALIATAVSGPRAVLLGFDLVEVDGETGLREGLRGFVVRRQLLDAQGGSRGQTVWLSDPRRGGGAAKPDEAEAGECSPAGRKVPWSSTLRRAIRDFKWGDYTVEPGSQYRYTVFTVYGQGDVATAPSSDTEAPSSDAEAARAPPTHGPGLHVGKSVELLVHTPPVYGGVHEVHFNRGAAGSQRFSHLFPEVMTRGPHLPEHWSWLSRGLEEALLRFIRLAEGPGWQLRCALYEAYYMPVIRELAAARDRGVDVQLTADWKPGAWSDEKRSWTQRGPQHMNSWALDETGLAEAGCVFRRTKPLTAISHNKFFVLVAPGNKPLAVWTGSTNITTGAVFGHSNVGHVVRDPQVCRQFLEYWERLKDDPEKKVIAAFNEEHSPLPSAEEWASAGDEGRGPDHEGSTLAFFSPRLQWASALDFLAQLAAGAKQSVAFTAAFGISKEMAPALTGGDESVIKYILLESEGNWAASRETVRELRQRGNVRVATGAHVDQPSQGSSWLPEALTGLNAHVKYIHTKILLVDPFSENPIVVSGSANFSRASMESNDENMLVVRGNRDLADTYAVEFFRIFEHMRFRNELDPTEKPRVGADCQVLCKCREAAAERVVSKVGPNTGRLFRACAKGDRGCGFFAWVPDPDAEGEAEDRRPPWPQCAFEARSFDRLERLMLGGVLRGAAAAAAMPSQDSECDQLADALAGLSLESFAPQGGHHTPAQVAAAVVGAKGGYPTKAAGGQGGCPAEGGAHPAEASARAVEATQRLLAVDSNQRGGGGTALYRERCAELVPLLEALPQQAARAEALAAVAAAEKNFRASTVSSWRPHILDVLKALGAGHMEAEM